MNQDRDEMLLEMLQNQKKTLHHARIESIANLMLIAVLVVALMVVLPKAVALIDHMETSLTEIDAAVANANEAVENVNRVVVDNTDAMTEAVEKLNKVDFDRLNEAIGGLANVVAPLSRFANMFGG